MPDLLNFHAFLLMSYWKLTKRLVKHFCTSVDNRYAQSLHVVDVRQVMKLDHTCSSRINANTILHFSRL